MSEKHLYVDLSNICHRSLYALFPDIKSNGFGIFRHGVLKSIILLIEKFNPNKVFICCDSPRNWRKKYYEPYKAHRADARKKLDIDWSEFHEVIDEMIMGFKGNFPFYVLRQDWMEADDLISYLTRKNNNAEKIIVSSDSDFIQLLRYPGTKIYCPLKQDFIKCDNPIHYLECKIVRGDKNSDNIPSICPGVGPKKAEALIESGDMDNLLQGKPTSDKVKGDKVLMVANYHRNSKLIDLTKTPKALIDILEKEFDNIKPASSKGVYNYVVKHKMRDMFYKISQIQQTMRKLDLPTQISNSEDPFQLEQQSPNS